MSSSPVVPDVPSRVSNFLALPEVQEIYQEFDVILATTVTDPLQISTFYQVGTDASIVADNFNAATDSFYSIYNPIYDILYNDITDLITAVPTSYDAYFGPNGVQSDIADGKKIIFSNLSYADKVSGINDVIAHSLDDGITGFSAGYDNVVSRLADDFHKITDVITKLGPEYGNKFSDVTQSVSLVLKDVAATVSEYKKNADSLNPVYANVISKFDSSSNPMVPSSPVSAVMMTSSMM